MAFELDLVREHLRLDGIKQINASLSVCHLSILCRQSIVRYEYFCEFCPYISFKKEDNPFVLNIMFFLFHILWSNAGWLTQ